MAMVVLDGPTSETTSSSDPLEYSQAFLIDAYRTMLTIRVFEERLNTEAAIGNIPGFLHLCAGQEASAVGIIQHLNKNDKVASTHRGHGHCIAKGMDLSLMAAEMFGKRTGYGQGKGGSMHMADRERGLLGTNGIVAAGAPLICGAALAAKMKGDRSVGVVFLGDGASNQGTFLESLNLAAAWNLPVLFVIENNGYADSTSRDYATAVDSYVDRAAGFGLPGITVDGLDFFAVYEAAGEMIARARDGGGPGLMECTVVRMFGHYQGDSQTYRAKGEVDDIRQNKDCITLFLERARLLNEAELVRIRSDIHAEVDRAIQYADKSPFPTAADLVTDVYS
jgi:acetoin:2,6-dichlorophenolindophenol oxidoreductase subunit alpha